MWRNLNICVAWQRAQDINRTRLKPLEMLKIIAARSRWRPLWRGPVV
jgi:hypothetical protein